MFRSKLIKVFFINFAVHILALLTVASGLFAGTVQDQSHQLSPSSTAGRLTATNQETAITLLPGQNEGKLIYHEVLKSRCYRFGASLSTIETDITSETADCSNVGYYCDYTLTAMRVEVFDLYYKGVLLKENNTRSVPDAQMSKFFPRSKDWSYFQIRKSAASYLTQQKLVTCK